MICFLFVGIRAEDKECWGQNRREYGPNCEYQCYCKNGGEYCDRVDGSCVSGCGDGRFGPGCQFGRILLYSMLFHLYRVGCSVCVVLMTLEWYTVKPG